MAQGYENGTGEGRFGTDLRLRYGGTHGNELRGVDKIIITVTMQIDNHVKYRRNFLVWFVFFVVVECVSFRRGVEGRKRGGGRGWGR